MMCPIFFVKLKKIFEMRKLKMTASTKMTFEGKQKPAFIISAIYFYSVNIVWG